MVDLVLISVSVEHADHAGNIVTFRSRNGQIYSVSGDIAISCSVIIQVYLEQRCLSDSARRTCMHLNR